MFLRVCSNAATTWVLGHRKMRNIGGVLTWSQMLFTWTTTTSLGSQTRTPSPPYDRNLPQTSLPASRRRSSLSQSLSSLRCLVAPRIALDHVAQFLRALFAFPRFDQRTPLLQL